MSQSTWAQPSSTPVVPNPRPRICTCPHCFWEDFHPTNIGGCRSNSGHSHPHARASGSCRAPQQPSGCRHPLLQTCPCPCTWGHTMALSEGAHKLERGRCHTAMGCEGQLGESQTHCGQRGHFNSRQGTPERWFSPQIVLYGPRGLEPPQNRAHLRLSRI